jgi:opacity protein-like surface antigen
MKILPLCLALFSLSTTALHAQALPAAVKSGGLKVGAGLVLAHPDYSPNNEAGFGIFANYDFLDHFGAELQFHQVGGSSATSVSERTFEVGGRFLWNFHPDLPLLGPRQITPFLKIDVGAGTFSFQNKYQNATYGLYAGGGGFDYNVTRKFDARVEYEYQRWRSFTPNGLQPNLLTIGVAYRLR